MIILTVVIIVSILLAAIYYSERHMPGKTYTGAIPQLTEEQLLLMGVLKNHIHVLAEDIGPRNIWRYEKLKEAAGYIENNFRESGYEVISQEYSVENKKVRNLEARITGETAPEEIIVIGAHYDTVEETPGANDNGSGIAALLEMARLLHGSKPSLTIRFVAFVNEEPPFFKSPSMGSLVYAREARMKGEKIVAMFSLETIGYYSNAEESQSFPFPPLRFVYPTTGNFIAFVTNFHSRKLLRKSLASFRRHAAFPSEGLAAPGWLTGVDWSDHWSFWKLDFPAVMITDTALYRYQHYHSRRDTPDKLSYPEMTLVVEGLTHMVKDLAGVPSP